jgi:putative PIN family toxin of toxin-antitoxin system
MIDANILISSFIKQNSTPEKAVSKATKLPYKLYLCDTVINEVRKFFNTKFTDRKPKAESFYQNVPYHVVKLSPADKPYPDEALIRDENDRPILRAALKAGVDILVTGDNDFLESGVKIPRILTAVCFINT